MLTGQDDQPLAATGRAVVVHPFSRRSPRDDVPDQTRSPEARLEEAVRLAHAIALTVVHAGVVRLTRMTPATLLGGGTVQQLAAQVVELNAGLIIIDALVSPVQQRNLERALKVKVIDRTGLILEIFGARAHTREGQLQVELAALTYQRSRLVRSWTHLERQRGGFGFLGGPGESQIELDRRLIGDRIVKIKRELDDVRRTRSLHRKARERVPYPVVALVGYTNAGKSTLFNRLAGADVFAKDLLFATLDPTMRAITLPSGRKVILSDTVGFISDLPTTLVAAFRATLEEVTAADLILHVRDVAHPDHEVQREDVNRVLRELGIDCDADPRLVEVLNKIDCLDVESRAAALAQARHAQVERGGGGQAVACALSALTGEGLDTLCAVLDRHMTAGRLEVTLAVPHGDGAALAWLYQWGEVLTRRDDSEHVHLCVALDPADWARFHKRHPELAGALPSEPGASESWK
ncbi:ribosome rescue factor HflX [uncultured Gammaproteobacteria bacterium]